MDTARQRVARSFMREGNFNGASIVCANRPLDLSMVERKQLPATADAGVHLNTRRILLHESTPYLSGPPTLFSSPWVAA